jgi:hypothetical protein
MRAAIAASIALCIAAPAHADRADQLFKKGKKLLAEKRYAEACTAFEDSDRLDPGIGAKLNVAKCYQEWGKLATAWRWYSDAEAMASTARDERAKRIHAIIVELDATVPRLTIKLPPGAATDDLVIKLDGVDLALDAIGTERRVDPGTHQLDTVVAGVRTSKVVRVERGGASEITVELPRKARTAGPAIVADPGHTRRMVGLGTAGAGGAAIVISGIVTLRARDDYKHALDGHCAGASNMCDDIGLSVTHGARGRANIATVFTLLGVGAIAGGVYLYVTAPKPMTREHALYLAPQLGPDGTGLVVGGAF